mmetsp:Transcript_107582/g.314562  ORF Transcript_107582/g.314562 Transcript_107582/m.314562 type:complete len:246 (+) Transcript_107582:917-1654(+)
MHLQRVHRVRRRDGVPARGLLRRRLQGLHGAQAVLRVLGRRPGPHPVVRLLRRSRGHRASRLGRRQEGLREEQLHGVVPADQRPRGGDPRHPHRGPGALRPAAVLLQVVGGRPCVPDGRLLPPNDAKPGPRRLPSNGGWVRAHEQAEERPAPFRGAGRAPGLLPHADPPHRGGAVPLADRLGSAPGHVHVPVEAYRGPLCAAWERPGGLQLQCSADQLLALPAASHLQPSVLLPLLHASIQVDGE